MAHLQISGDDRSDDQSDDRVVSGSLELADVSCDKVTGPGNIPAPSPGSLTLSPIFSTLNERAEFVSIATFSEKLLIFWMEWRGRDSGGEILSRNSVTSLR